MLRFVTLALTVASSLAGSATHFTLAPPHNISETDLATLMCQYDAVLAGEYVDFFGETEDVDKLVQRGYRVLNSTEGRPFREVNPPSGYTTPDDLMLAFRAFESAYPDLAQLVDLTARYDKPQTALGRNIYALKISDRVQSDEDEDNVLIVSNHHSRELITPEIALDSATRLLEGYGHDDDITSLVDNLQIYIIWTLNPDGLHWVWDEDNNWRKNRRDNGGSFGVDLNRNYPIDWAGSCGGSSTPASNTYRGPVSGSEPEVATMMAFQRERMFSKVLDFHSSGRDVRPNYGACATLPTAMDSYFIQLATAHAAEMNYIYRISCCMAGDIDHAYAAVGALSHLSETGTAFQPPADQMRDEVLRIWPGTLWFLQLPTAMAGHVTDVGTGGGVEANFDIAGYSWSYDERRSSRPGTGRYHLWLPEGQHEVTVSATGFAPQSFAVTITPEGLSLDIALERTPLR